MRVAPDAGELALDGARDALRRDVRLLVVMMLTFPAFQGLVATLLPLLLGTWRAHETTVGLIQAVPGVVALAVAAPLARLANTRWRKATLALSFAAALVASALLSLARGVGGLVLPQMLVGLAASGYYANLLPTAFRLADGDRQHAIQAALTVAQGVGFFAGPLAAGFLAERSYVAGFLTGAGCALVGLVACALLGPSASIEGARGWRRELSHSYRRLAQVSAGRPLVRVGIAFTYLNIAMLLVMGGSFFLLYARGVGVSPLVAAAMLSGRELLGAIVRLTYPAASRRFRVLALVGVGTVLGSASIAFVPLARGAGGLLAVTVGIGLSIAYMLPGLNMLSGASVAREEQPFAVVGMMLANLAAQTTMAPIFGLLVTLAGYSIAYPVTGVLWVALSVWLTLRGMRYAPPREAP